MVLKKCEPGILWILAKPSNTCLNESCFQDYWKVSSVLTVFENVGERSIPKDYCPVSLFSVVFKVFKEPVNNRLVDHLIKYGRFLHFQCGFRSSPSTTDLLKVGCVRVFNRSGATQAQGEGIYVSKAFNSTWHATLLHKLKSPGSSGE